MKDKHKRAYMECAEAFAKCSVGERLKVGTVIVKNNRIISCGYNALPAHIDGPLEINNVTRPEVRHSEINALMGLVRSSESASGATLFCTHSSCKQCAIDIVDTGIAKVIYKHDFRCSEGLEYLIKNGLEVEKIDWNRESGLHHTLGSFIAAERVRWNVLDGSTPPQ
jgi:dCMP deaminase